MTLVQPLKGDIWLVDLNPVSSTTMNEVEDRLRILFGL